MPYNLPEVYHVSAMQCAYTVQSNMHHASLEVHCTAFSTSLCIVQEQLLEEQKSILGQLYEERRALAEERAQFNLNQKLKMEQEQRENLKVMKVCR